jgi:hypothetical protein
LNHAILACLSELLAVIINGVFYRESVISKVFNYRYNYSVQSSVYLVAELRGTDFEWNVTGSWFQSYKKIVVADNSLACVAVLVLTVDYSGLLLSPADNNFGTKYH